MFNPKTPIRYRIVALALLLSISLGMMTSMCKKADAADGWKVTFTFYNGQAQETRQNVPNGATISLPTPNATANATFWGWKCGNTFYSAGKTAKVTGNMNFVCVWQVLVNFYDYDGRQVDQRVEKTGYPYSLAATPQKANCVFGGWFTSSGEKIDGTICTKAYKHDVTAKRNTDAACMKIDKVLSGVYDPGYKDEETGKTKYLFGSNGITNTSGKNFGYVKQSYNRKPTACGMCPINAIANLLNRRSVYDHNECRFIFEDHVIPVFYPAETAQSAKKSRKRRDPSSSQYSYSLTHSSVEEDTVNDKVIGKNGTEYVVVAKQYSTISGSENIKKRKQELVKLLNAHPEGIVIWSRYASNERHACVLTNYTISASGDITFYAIDTAGSIPSGGYRSYLPFKNAHICTGYSKTGVDNAIAYINRIWYIQ